MCTGNKIKTLNENAINCDADEPCDGVKTVPNNEHTACGMSLAFNFGNPTETSNISNATLILGSKD